MNRRGRPERKITTTELATIRRMVKARATVPQIAAALQMPISTLYYRMDKSHLRFYRPNKASVVAISPSQAQSNT